MLAQTQGEAKKAKGLRSAVAALEYYGPAAAPMAQREVKEPVRSATHHNSSENDDG